MLAMRKETKLLLLYLCTLLIAVRAAVDMNNGTTQGECSTNRGLTYDWLELRRSSNSTGPGVELLHVNLTQASVGRCHNLRVAAKAYLIVLFAVRSGYATIGLRCSRLISYNYTFTNDLRKVITAEHVHANRWTCSSLHSRNHLRNIHSRSRGLAKVKVMESNSTLFLFYREYLAILFLDTSVSFAGPHKVTCTF